MRNKLFCSTTMVNLDWSLVLNVAQNHFSKVLTRHFSVASQFIFSCVCLLSILPSLKKQQTSDSSMPVRSLPASAKIIKLRCKLFRAWETAGTAWWLMLSACNQAALMSQSSRCHRLQCSHSASLSGRESSSIKLHFMFSGYSGFNLHTQTHT